MKSLSVIFRLSILLCLITLFSLADALATVWTYPGQSQFKSTKYEVKVTQNGTTKSSFVYEDANKNTSNLGSMTNFNHWTTFSFNGTITVEVTKLGGNIGSAEIRPLSRNYQPQISGNKLTFTITKPEKLWIKMQGMYENPLFIFADEPEVNAPTGPSANVVYWGPGVHNVGKHYKLEANKTYYLAGGAYLKGSFLCENNASNITVRGRGILSGEDIAHCGYNECRFDRAAIRFQGSNNSNLEVEGITVINPAQYCLQAYGGDLETHNVKFFGWWFETDGWVAGNGTTLYDSFFKVYDDIVKLYFDNLHIHDLVIYKQHNGAPFQLGWSSESGNDNLVENIDVIYDETNWNQTGLEGNRGFINHANGNSSSTVQRMTFRNINFDEDISYLIGIKSQGTVKNFTLENINVRGTQKYKSYMAGGNMSGFSLKNVKINGDCIDKDADIDLRKAGTIGAVSYLGCGVVQGPEFDPVISFTDPAANATISGNHTLKTLAYDEDFGTTHGSGVTSVFYQIFDVNDPTTALFSETVSQAPFYWNLNTADFPDGDYEFRAGVASEDFTGRKWTVLKPVTIKNNTGGSDFVTSFTYPTAAGQAFASDKYDVYVKAGNGPEQKLQVLMSDVNYRTMYDGDWMKAENKDRTFSFVHLDYDVAGPQLTFRVVKKFGNNSNSAVISPKSYGYTPNLTSGKELTFKVNENNKYISVNFKGADNESPNRGWIKNMLCIFVDPPETGKPTLGGAGVVKYTNNVGAAALSNASVIYFPAGYHNLRNYNNGGPIDNDGVITLKSEQSIYMEGGAFVEGIIQRAQYQDVNQRIFGRGILTGRQYYWKNHPNHSGPLYGELVELGDKAEVKGIMYMESPNHGVVGRNVHIENVKFLGWHSNHDGVRVGGGSEIHNSFFRAVDDHFYNFGIHVHDCVLWAGHNGSIMTYGWGGGENSNNYAATGSIMENIDIINPEWTNLGNNNGLIMSQVGYNHPVNGTTIIRNIRMEGTIPGITNLKPRSNGSGNIAVQVPTGEVSFVGDLILENISVEAQFQKGLIRGEADPDFNGNKKWLVKDVLFKNVSVGGTCINDNNKNQFFNIDNNTIQNVVFDCGTTNPTIVDIDDLTAEVLSCNSIKLVWGDVNNETGYRVRRKTESSNYIILQDIAANATSYTDETAEENVSYTYMVRPLDGSTAVATSNVVPISSGTCPAEVLLPVNSWDNILEGQVLSGLVNIKTLAYDPNYGTNHGDGIQQINYQIFDANDLSTQLLFVPVTESPFYWELNTEDFPNGEYQLRAGAISLDTDEKKWTVINVKISNVITGNTTGIAESEFEVYPNPSNGLIHLSKETNWNIQNLAGQMLRSGTGSQVDISDLQGGTYLLFTEYGIERVVKY